MRLCAHCGHENAESLVYCFRCGRRLDGSRAAPAATGGPAWPRGSGAPSGRTDSPTAGFAATVALPSSRLGRLPAPGTPEKVGGWPRRALAALGYLFAYVRGRIDAEDRKRSLAEERRGAERMIEAVLMELGTALVADPTPPPALGDAIAAVLAARGRREAAAADLASGEKLQAAEDLRLGLEQAAAENEWQACARAADEVDRMLRDIEDQRRGLDEPGARGVPAGTVSAEPGASAAKRALLDEQFSTARDRAAALRASTTAARAKLEQATAARRKAAAAMAAGLAAQARARSEAERAMAEATMSAGRRARELRLPGPELDARYERVDRLQQVITEADTAVGTLDARIGGYDNRRLLAGAGVLCALIAVVAAGLWLVLR